MFWNKEKKEEKSPKNTKCRLTITMSDGHLLSWDIGVQKEVKDMRMYWMDFYKWFFCRAGDTYVMNYTNGLTMIYRKNITRFNISITE